MKLVFILKKLKLQYSLKSQQITSTIVNVPLRHEMAGFRTVDYLFARNLCHARVRGQIAAADNEVTGWRDGVVQRTDDQLAGRVIGHMAEVFG